MNTENIIKPDCKFSELSLDAQKVMTTLLREWYEKTNFDSNALLSSGLNKEDFEKALIELIDTGLFKMQVEEYTKSGESGLRVFMQRYNLELGKYELIGHE